MAGIAGFLSLGAYVVGKDLADRNPGHGALPEGEEGNVSDKEPDQSANVRACLEEP